MTLEPTPLINSSGERKSGVSHCGHLRFPSSFQKTFLVLRVSFVVCIALILGFFSFLHKRQYAHDARNAAARKILISKETKELHLHPTCCRSKAEHPLSSTTLQGLLGKDMSALVLKLTSD
ncbi:hypothetical protein CY35_18G065500 [Sphagnum magellanicum]|nr:hypothetical protein CY35_18G065500 [Sphagnum magellanicum]